METDPEDSPEAYDQQEQHSSPDLEQAIQVAQPTSNGPVQPDPNPNPSQGPLALTVTLTPHLSLA